MRLFALVLVAQLLASAIPVCAAQKEEGATFYSLNATENLIQLYEDPDRINWQKPEKVVEQLSIKPGEIVADIGAGTGYFSVLFAKKVGESGIVYAVDIDKALLEYTGKRVLNDGLKNVKVMLAKPDDSLLPKSSLDLVFMCDTYMFIEHRERYLVQLKEILKKGGRLAIISFNKVETPEGPPVHTRVSREKTIQEVEKAGFVLEAEYFFLPYQHFLVFGKQ